MGCTVREMILFELLQGDCLELMPTMAENSVDSIVTDPPYGLSFMGKNWDHGVPGVEFWREALRVLKPGGHILAFGGSRTSHRLAVAIEDAGFDLRDTIMWVYGSGFPKSLDVSKALDKMAGAERGSSYVPHGGNKVFGEGKGKAAGVDRTPGAVLSEPAVTDEAKQWAGWGTALKPAHEPIIVARKPLIGTVAANVLTHGTGGLNIDGCRVAHLSEADRASATPQGKATAKSGALAGGSQHDGERAEFGRPDTSLGRWPANLIHDGSDEVLAAFPNAKGQQGDLKNHAAERESPNGCFGKMAPARDHIARNDSGSAARFFYCAKASKADREEGNKHPTVKPTELMRYLRRLATPPGGVVLDPFMGSGSTGKAAIAEGFRFVGVEQEQPSFETAKARIEKAAGIDLI